MSRKARKDKQIRRNVANRDGYMVRYFKRYLVAGRKVNGDRHMQHTWLPTGELRVRTPAPFHKGRKP